MSIQERLTWFPEMEDLALYNREPPMVTIPAEVASRIEKELAPLRFKKWASSTRATSRADAIGLMGEIAFQRFLGVSTSKAEEDFFNGLSGDKGIDAWLGEMSIDVKTSALKNLPLKFLFTKTNRFSNRANVVVFVHIRESQMGDIHCSLIGWAYKAEVNRFLRDSDKYPNLQTLRIDTLRRHGDIYPVNHLLLQNPAGRGQFNVAERGVIL